jgi:hypothetical protein
VSSTDVPFVVGTGYFASKAATSAAAAKRAEPPRRRLPVQGSRRAFKAGTYTCQINIVDAIASNVAFPRLSFVVMD